MASQARLLFHVLGFFTGRHARVFGAQAGRQLAPALAAFPQPRVKRVHASDYGRPLAGCPCSAGRPTLTGNRIRILSGIALRGLTRVAVAKNR